MNENSKRTTYPEAGVGFPVQVKGYARAWIVQSENLPLGLTFLGAVPSAHSQLNATLFSVALKAVTQYDSREQMYCRQKINPELLSPLTTENLPSGQIWMYVYSQEKAQKPDRLHPLVQSYVDIFLSGCLQLEEKYQIKNFARQCVRSTNGWSQYWVNDRIYPRRAWQFQPYSLKIDALLLSEKTDLFKKIKIE